MAKPQTWPSDLLQGLPKYPKWLILENIVFSCPIPLTFNRLNIDSIDISNGANQTLSPELRMRDAGNQVRVPDPTRSILRSINQVSRAKHVLKSLTISYLFPVRRLLQFFYSPSHDFQHLPMSRCLVGSMRISIGQPLSFATSSRCMVPAICSCSLYICTIASPP